MMSSIYSDKRKRHRCIDEAAEWLVTLQCGELADKTKEAFAEWLLSSTDNVREYLKMAMLGDDIASLQAPALPTADQLKRAIAAEDPKAEVVSLFDREAQTSDRDEKRDKSNSKRTGLSRFAIAASIALVAIGVSLFWPFSESPREIYQTAIGEQSSLVLEDGSTITLNTQTEVQVSFDGKNRNLYLNSGEALFQVAKDAKRPFRVHVDGVVVQAVGTEFNIRHFPGRVEATLLEGVVDVHSEFTKSPVRLTVSDQAVINRVKESIEVASVDLAEVTAWQQRKLVFDGRSLKDAVAEFNRYNRAKIVIFDSALESQTVSGVFNATDPDSFTLFLKAANLARVNRSDAGTVLTSVKK